MVASQAVMEHRPADITAELTVKMEAYAASGDWERVEEIAVKLRTVVMRVPENERRSALQAVRRSMEKVQNLAQYARNDVKEKLSVIRRGQNATRAYAAAD